jgi:4-carboxymuconolactone decarboxylase
MTSSSNPVRIPPLEEDEWTPAIREALFGSTWLAPEHALPKPSATRATMARHEKLFATWDPFGSTIFNGELPARDREVMVIRTAWLTQCQVEWAYHIAPSERAGMTKADFEAIFKGPEAEGLSEWDRVLVKVVDQLREHGTLDDATWATLATRYNTNQLIEVPIVAGHYVMIAYALNSFGSPVPEGTPLMPSPSDM